MPRECDHWQNDLKLFVTLRLSRGPWRNKHVFFFLCSLCFCERFQYCNGLIDYNSLITRGNWEVGVLTCKPVGVGLWESHLQTWVIGSASAGTECGARPKAWIGSWKLSWALVYFYFCLLTNWDFWCKKSFIVQTCLWENPLFLPSIPVSGDRLGQIMEVKSS